jgi:hypothetical protein
MGYLDTSAYGAAAVLLPDCGTEAIQATGFVVMMKL